MSSLAMSHSRYGPWKSGWYAPAGAASSPLRWLFLILCLAAALVASPAHSAVSLRVDGQPVSSPIDVYATVTDGSGNPVAGLTASNFTVLVDGVAVPAPTFSLPPAQDTSKKVSVIFVMDYSPSVVDPPPDGAGALADMQNAVIGFINQMNPGDYAAVVKFTGTQGATTVQPFTMVDGGAGTQALVDAVNAPYGGRRSIIFDAVVEAIDQFNNPGVSLPAGPKAMILISDGDENGSQADINAALDAAVAAQIPVFTVGVGDFTSQLSQTVLNSFPDQTSGVFYPAPSNADIANAYLQVQELLNNEYLLSFTSSITDCGTHTVEVRVTGQTAVTEQFQRCTDLLAPDVRGQTVAQATTTLNGFGLVVGTVTNAPDLTVPAGRVVSQDPVVGTVVLAGDAVALTVSSGPPPATVPNVVGQTQAAATSAITGATLVVGTVTQQNSTTVPAGNVISQSPSAGTVTVAGAAVDLVVSSGPPQVTVPNVVGLSQSAAQSAITGASLAVGTVTQQASTTVAAGNVISQSPASGTSVDQGSSVSLVVSSGPPPPSGGGGGGGGGATGPFELLAGLLLLLVTRLRRVT